MAYPVNEAPQFNPPQPPICSIPASNATASTYPLSTDALTSLIPALCILDPGGSLDPEYLTYQIQSGTLALLDPFGAIGLGDRRRFCGHAPDFIAGIAPTPANVKAGFGYSPVHVPGYSEEASWAVMAFGTNTTPTTALDNGTAPSDVNTYAYLAQVFSHCWQATVDAGLIPVTGSWVIRTPNFDATPPWGWIECYGFDVGGSDDAFILAATEDLMGRWSAIYANSAIVD